MLQSKVEDYVPQFFPRHPLLNISNERSSLRSSLQRRLIVTLLSSSSSLLFHMTNLLPCNICICHSTNLIHPATYLPVPDTSKAYCHTLTPLFFFFLKFPALALSIHCRNPSFLSRILLYIDYIPITKVAAVLE